MYKGCTVLQKDSKSDFGSTMFPLINNDCQADYCDSREDIPHSVIKCPKEAEFWSYWFNWWEQLFGIKIKNNPVIEECIMFGFPLNTEAMQVLNYCIRYTKYYIYIWCPLKK